MPNLYTPTDEEASTLLDGVEGEADAGRKAQMVELLGNYRTSKQLAGSEPFAAGATIDRDRREALNGLFGDLNQVEMKLPVEAMGGFTAAVDASADRDEAKAMMVNQAWVAGNYPNLAGSVDADWNATKLHVAKSLWGTDVTDLPDKAFYGQIGAHLTKQKAEQEMVSGVMDKIRVEAAKGQGDWLAAWKKSATGISQDKAWDSNNHDRYRALAQRVWNETQEKIEPMRVAITVGQKYYHLAVNPEPNDVLLGQARRAFEDELMRLPKDQREVALQFAIAGAVDAAPQGMGAEGGAGFKEKLLESTKRAVAAFPQNVFRFGRQGIGAMSELGLLARHAYYGEADTPAAQLYQQQEQNDRVELDRKITTGLLTAVDPIKSKSRIIQGLYDTPQSLVYMTAAGLQPELGIPLALTAMAEDNRTHFIDNGVPPAEAAVLAFAAAVPQVAIERLQGNLLFKGKLPGFEKYLTKAVGSKLELARKMLVVGGLTTAAENLEEAVQDITIPLYQELGATLSEAVPDVKWLGKDGELAQFAGERVDTFFALLPLVLVGTGTASFKEAGFGRQYLQNKTLLKAAGFTEAAAEQISQTAVQDVQAAQDLVQTGWTNPEVRPAATKEKLSKEAADDLKAVGQMNTEEQQRAFDELDAQMKASWTEQANAQGARAVRQEDGTWVVVDSAGGLVDTAQTPEAALTLVEQADRAEGATLDNVVDDMIAYFKDRGRGGPIEKTGDIKTLQDEVEAGRMTQHQADSVVKLYVDLGTLPANTQADTARLYGESERVYNAKKKIYEYVSRLHDGADPLVLVEEESESYLKEALDRGEFTIEDIEKWQQAVGGKLPKYADEKLRRRGAVEFFSHYAQAYLTAKIQQENTAAVPLSVRRWLGKMKRVFAQIFQLAKNLIDLEDAGKLPAEFKKHLARAVGLDEAFIERRAREEERAEAGKTAGPELLEWVKGKLPHPGDYTGSFAGELRDIYDNLTKEVKVEARGVDQMGEGGKIKRARAGYKQVNKSTANAFFAKPGVEVDIERVVQAAREMGYDVADVNDLLVAVDNSFRGNLSYSNPQEDTQVKAGDESAARRAASVGGERTFAVKPKKDQSRDMFDEGLADEDFALSGGTAEDASGAVDREEARREAKRKADEAQGEMTLEERADAYVAAVGVPEAKRDEATFALKKLLAVAEDTQLELGGDYQPRTKEQQRLDELHDQAQAELGMSPQRAAQANVLTGDRGGIEASVETWKAAFGKDDRISAIIPALVRDPMKKWDIRGAIIKTPKDAAVLMQVLRTPYLETMKFIFLDGKNRVIHSEIGTIGTTTSSLAAPNVIARMLDRAGKGLSVRRVIIAHNHPSGDPAPSAADVQVTRQLNDATKSVGFELVDHIVTNGETYYSFAEQGMVSGTYTASKRGLMGKAKVVGEDAQGGGLPSPVLGQAQPWETVKMANLRVVNRPELAASMLNVLKQVDPTALHVFYLNRKNRMMGLERITNYAPANDQTAPAVMDPIELNRRIFEGIGRNGATAFIVAFPDAMGKGAASIMALRQLREFSKAVDVELLDALGPVWEMGGVSSSARLMGVLESAGRAPVETDPAKIASDRAEYDRLQAEMKTKAPLSPEYNALWQQSEDIKNRHGGFVPAIRDSVMGGQATFSLRAGDLIAVHNTNADKLRQMDELGGIAAPSIAIIRHGVSEFTSFGDISLIAPPDVIDPRVSKKAKVFNADVYSPRFPMTRHKIDGKKLTAAWNSLSDESEALGYALSSELDGSEIGNEGLRAFEDSSVVKLAFLKEKGIKPEFQMQRSEGADKTKVDRYYSNGSFLTQIEQAGLKQEFTNWVRQKFGGVITGKVVRDANPDTGYVRNRPYDLDTVVRMMKRELRDGEGFNYGVGSVRATVAKQFTSLVGIRADKANIVEKSVVEALKEETNEEFFQLTDELRPYYRYDSGAFGYLDQASQSFKELGQYGMRKWEENFKDTPPELLQKVRDFMQKLANAPTEYFEAKVQRGVLLSELAGAVIPDNTAPETRDILKKHGLKTVEYPRNDDAARAAAVASFTDSSFSIGPMDQSERVRQAMRPRMIPIRIKASDNFADEVKAMVGLPKYEVRGMDVNEKAAKKIILEHDGDMAKLLRLLSDPTQTMHPATKVALAFFMAETANKVGDYAAAADIAKQAAEAATAAGQGVNELKRWSIFSQPETAQQLLQTEIERENNRRKEREPAINAVVTVYADVQREARKLLKKWIDEINGVTAENRKPIDVSSLPDVTFSLSAEQRASGIVRVVAQMLKDSGADAVEAALLAKYGDKVEPHLTDILIEAQKSLTPRRAAEGKRFKTRQPVLGDAQIEQTLAGQRGKVEGQIDLSLDQMKAKGMTDEEIKAAMDAQRGRQGEQQTLGVEGTPRPGMTEAEIEAAMAEERALSGKGEAQASLNEVPGFENRLIDEMMQRLGAANVVVPRGIRDQITELLNMRGLAASEDDVKRIIGAGRLLPNMSPTQAQELADFAKRIGSTPLDSFERAQQTMELFSYVHDQLAPYDLVDVAFGLWYANVLSSLITSARNVTGNAGFLFLDETADMIFRNPTTYWEYLTRLSESVQSGLETAAPAAKNAMVRGQEGLQRSRSLDDERRQGVLESKKAPLEGVRRISRLATRFLSMQDLLFANTAYEMKARQIAYDQAVKDAKAGKIKEKDIAKQVTRELNESTEQIQTFADRAEKEWGNLHPEVQAGYDKANWVKRRTAELRLFERRHELVGRALDFAQKVTLDFQPEGMMGLLMGNLSRVFAMAEHAAQDIQNKPVRLMTKAAAKYGRTRVIPFMRVPVNVFNRALDYGPVGYGRALMDAAGIPILLSTGKTKTRTADERADLLKRATLGTLAMLPLALLCRPPEPGDEPEEFPWLQIHGAGSGTPATNLAQNGPKYRPYSLELQVGGKKLFIDYRMAPIAPYLAAIGALHDRTRYAKQMAEKTALVQGWILAQSMKEAFMSSSPITSLRELSEAAAENTPMSERSINRTLARATAGMAANIGIPLAGLWRSLDQLAGGDRNTRDTLLAASIAEIPVASRLNVPSLDTLGDPLTARTGIGWLADWQTMETPEARIYLAFAQKDVSPTDISPYQSKMTPEDFYAFAKLRGQYLKDELLGADEDGQTGLQRLNGLSDKPREAGEDSPAKKFLGRLSHNATRRALHDVGHEGEP